MCRTPSPSQKFASTPPRSMCCSRSAGSRPVLVDAQLAVLVGAQRGGERRLRAVDLRAVPPVAVDGDVGRRRRGVVVARSGRAACAGSASAARARRRRPRAARSTGSSGSFWPWLNQSCTSNWSQARGEHVQRRRRLEALAGEQLAADLARARVEERRQRLRERVPHRYVAAEARADGAHATARRGRSTCRPAAGLRGRRAAAAARPAVRSRCRAGSGAAGARAARRARGSRSASAAGPSRTAGRGTVPGRRASSPASGSFR